MDEERFVRVITPYKCLSTHGPSGYAMGSYWDGDDIICGQCGARITNPLPTGGTSEWVWDEGLLGRLHLKGHYIERPTWPSFIMGSRGQKAK